MLTKKQLAIRLSSFKKIVHPDEQLEQYSLDPEVASQILWTAYMKGDIQSKKVADFGCGSGTLGGGALLLLSKKVYFVEKDASSMLICKENIKNTKAHFITSDLKTFNQHVDTVLQNPPFGLKRIHADREFLAKAFASANVVYSIHKIESQGFIEQFSKDNGFRVEEVIPFDFILRRTLKHHRKEKYTVKCGCWILRKAV